MLSLCNICYACTDDNDIKDREIHRLKQDISMRDIIIDSFSRDISDRNDIISRALVLAVIAKDKNVPIDTDTMILTLNGQDILFNSMRQ